MGGIPCDRKECTTCTQGIEEIPDCTRRSIVYESICKKCVPEATKPGPVEPLGVDTPCIYVGESSRSIAERAGEHWDAYRARKPDSHIWKHHLVHHDGQGEPEMVFKMVGTFKSALSRQINEAVIIKNRGILALNSKSEYDRCRIHRLTVGEEQKSNLQEQVPETSNDGTKGEQFLMNRRVEMDKNSRRDAQGNVSVTKARKRNMMVGVDVTRPNKKRKYVLVGPDWGGTSKQGEQGLDCLVEEEVDAKNVETGPLSNKKCREEGLTVTVCEASYGGGTALGDVDNDNVSTHGTGPLNEEITGLYEAASNLVTIREARKDCIVKKMHCGIHDQEARRYTSTKENRTICIQNEKTECIAL